MGESHEKINRDIKHYQEYIEKYTERNNYPKLLHCIQRLDKLPIEVVHLEQTGVGRTVNSLRKLGGEVGDAAKALVWKWKEMVVEQQVTDSEEEEDEDGYETGETGDNPDSDKEPEQPVGAHKDEAKPTKHEEPRAKHEEKKERKEHHKSEEARQKQREEHSKSKSHHKRHLEATETEEESKKRHKKDHEEARKSESHKKHKKSKQSSESKHKERRSDDCKKHKHKDKSRLKDRKDKEKSSNKAMASGSGASFAEALGMCEASSSKKKSSSTAKKEKSSTKTEDVLLIPKPPKEPVPLDNVELNISSLLPQITPNYRPLGNSLNLDSPHKKNLSDYEALSNIITSKNQRTRVYSGNKSAYAKVPKLFELCLRVLQDNIDALEYTGGVPYLVLKPVLEKANPDQLYTMEHHNPYLIDDTDELWKLHCQKDFRNKKREEMETWREMYMRCLDERDARLKNITATIKEAQDKALPVRTTKLAYVDAVAKPPRNIARKQAKNGTALIKSPAITPSARLTTLATAGEAGKVAVPNPGARAVERSNNQVMKVKKAPLMVKSLSLLKNRFRR